MDETTEQALRAVVRLLARQAARELIESAGVPADDAGHAFDRRLP